ncbi:MULTISPECIES: cobalt ECF transporter T component CbiQ [unclassified Paludibacterium]|uniref:cobalt ECF transporter T component CbiQ n=1 Tax=unclassified Paludibacterium TaxID=2618429 RepID=UPI001C05CD1F|nr:cobalt ECF transporter T component CbiQ [Paludibacterium sp. B53371]BEV71938.1 cobalt ECF transporter T component CbiQ [Paludibacterium sp. THUN1379]
MVSLARHDAVAASAAAGADGRIKTLLLLAAVVVASTLRHGVLALALWLGALALFALLGLNGRDLCRRLLMPLGIAWVVLLSVMLTRGSQVLWQVPLWGWTLRVYAEGLQYGGLLFLRIMAAVTLAALLAMTTPMVEILATLRLCRVPLIMIELAEMMYRYLFILQDTAQTMRRAQLSRLGAEAGWLGRVADVGRLAASILIKSLDRSTRIYQAMLARGYDENSPVMTHFRSAISRRDYYVGLLGLCALSLLAFFNYWLG